MRFLRFSLLLLFTLSVAPGDGLLGCDSDDSIIQYAIVAKSAITEPIGAIEIRNVTRASCVHFCNRNRNHLGENFPCKGFGYKADENVCLLFEKSKRRANDEDHSTTDGTAIFEKLCLNARQTCTAIPAFEKYPNHVLLGFTEIILENIPSLESCLNECLESNDKHKFQCLSVNYYYDNQDCMLNSDSRLTKGVLEFFSNDTEDYKVDYFDNLCEIRKKNHGKHYNACPSRTTPTFIRFNGSEISQGISSNYSDLNASECLRKCADAENFTCNAASHQSSDSSCRLSHLEHRDLQELNQTHNADFYYKRVCLEGSHPICATEQTDILFDAISDFQLPSEFAISEISGISPEECLSHCLHDLSQECQSVNYDLEQSRCRLNNGTAADASLIDFNSRHNSTIYYENLCFSKNVSTEVNVSNVANETTVTEWEIPEEPTTTSKPETSANVTDSAGPWVTEPNQNPNPNFDVEAICDYSDMRVRLTSDEAFSGHIFAKNKFGTCNKTIENKTEIIFSLKFANYQGPESPCGVVQTSPDLYSAIIVVTTNTVGIPGLLMEGDKFFNVSCDFNSTLSPNKVTASGRTISVEARRDAPALFPNGTVIIPSPLTMRLTSNSKARSQVKTVIIGEQLNLDFNLYPGFNNTELGLFVRQCNASRHFGPPPEPDALILIEDGCPSKAAKGRIVSSAILEKEGGFTLPFKAFRFDGSNSVKITCAVNLCEKGCKPAECDLHGQKIPSHGKRKKRSTENSDSYDPKSIEESSVIFTVMDKLQNFGSREINENSSEQPKVIVAPNTGYFGQYLRYQITETKKQVCLKKKIFIISAIGITTVCVGQAIFIAAYLAYHFVKLGSNKCE